MKLLIISDLHIGKNSKFNSFGWNCYEFIEYLGFYINELSIDKVILNGDIFDLYQHSYSEIYSENKDLVDFFNHEKFIYIRGNHDFLHKSGADSINIENSKGEIIHIEHGHNADLLNGTIIGRFFGKSFYYLLVRLMNFNFVKHLFYKIVEYNDEINRIPRKYNTYKYLQYALKLLKKNDVVILSHTHKLEDFKTYFLNNKKRYLNSGSCSMGRFQGIVIDTETLKTETIKVNKDKIKSCRELSENMMISA